MKLRNKKTGRIVDWEHGLQYKLGKEYHSIKEFTEEWEDYKEPKKYWFIDSSHPHQQTVVFLTKDLHLSEDKSRKQIGNYFSSEEEAELAVRKLKAWKRLRDAGFKFELWNYNGGNYEEKISTGRILFRVSDNRDINKYLDLLFSGGEE